MSHFACFLHYSALTNTKMNNYFFNWLFRSKPNNLIVLIFQYLTLFNFLGWIMSNYSFWFVLFQFISFRFVSFRFVWFRLVLRFESPLFLLVSIYLGNRLCRFDWAMDRITNSTIRSSLLFTNTAQNFDPYLWQKHWVKYVYFNPNSIYQLVFNNSHH